MIKIAFHRFFFISNILFFVIAFLIGLFIHSQNTNFQILFSFLSLHLVLPLLNNALNIINYVVLILNRADTLSENEKLYQEKKQKFNYFIFGLATFWYWVLIILALILFFISNFSVNFFNLTNVILVFPAFAILFILSGITNLFIFLNQRKIKNKVYSRKNFLWIPLIIFLILSIFTGHKYWYNANSYCSKPTWFDCEEFTFDPDMVKYENKISRLRQSYREKTEEQTFEIDFSNRKKEDKTCKLNETCDINGVGIRIDKLENVQGNLLVEWVNFNNTDKRRQKISVEHIQTVDGFRVKEERGVDEIMENVS